MLLNFWISLFSLCILVVCGFVHAKYKTTKLFFGCSSTSGARDHQTRKNIHSNVDTGGQWRKNFIQFLFVSLILVSFSLSVQLAGSRWNAGKTVAIEGERKTEQWKEGKMFNFFFFNLSFTCFFFVGVPLSRLVRSLVLRCALSRALEVKLSKKRVGELRKVKLTFHLFLWRWIIARLTRSRSHSTFFVSSFSRSLQSTVMEQIDRTITNQWIRRLNSFIFHNFQVSTLKHWISSN